MTNNLIVVIHCRLHLPQHSTERDEVQLQSVSEHVVQVTLPLQEAQGTAETNRQGILYITLRFLFLPWAETLNIVSIKYSLNVTLVQLKWWNIFMQCLGRVLEHASRIQRVSILVWLAILHCLDSCADVYQRS